MGYIGNLNYLDMAFGSLKLPKVTIDSNGFYLDKEFIPKHEIISVFYNNRFSPKDKIAHIYGFSSFQMLTTNGRAYFHGEHFGLQDWLDKNLEKVTFSEYKVLGNVKRWKKPNTAYCPVTIDDYLHMNLIEKWENVKIDGRVVPLLFIAFGLLIISLLFYLLSK